MLAQPSPKPCHLLSVSPEKAQERLPRLPERALFRPCTNRLPRVTC
jgi:hypothetical protein